jgi:hypothetical protein
VFLEKSQTMRIAVVKGKSTTPETAADIRSLVAVDDLCLPRRVYRRDARPFAHLCADLVDKTVAGHVVEEF